MLIALATVLNQFASFDLPFLMGGGITIFSQVPIIALGYIFGVRWGLISGFTMSLLQLMFGFSNFSYVKGMAAYIILALLDYLVPYTLLGLGGMFKGRFKSSYVDLTVGTVMVCLIRYICHFLSGITVWADYTDGNAIKAIITYSLSYNAGYMVPETIVTVIGILALNKFLFPKLDDKGMLK